MHAVNHHIAHALLDSGVTFPNPISKTQLAKDALARLVKEDERYAQIPEELQKRKEPKFGAIYTSLMNMLRRPAIINAKLAEMKKEKEKGGKEELDESEDVQPSDESESVHSEQQVDPTFDSKIQDNVEKTGKSSPKQQQIQTEQRPAVAMEAQTDDLDPDQSFWEALLHPDNPYRRCRRNLKQARKQF